MAIKPKRPGRSAADERDKKATPKVATEESRQTKRLAGNENESRQTKRLAGNENESRALA